MSTLKTNSITHISNSGTANISLTNDGKVGIGVTSPDAPLTIHSSSDPEIRFGYSASQDHRIGWDSSNVHIHADPENGTANSSIRLYVDGTEGLRLDSSARLLLGTTATGQSGEADALTIYKNAHTGITIRTGTSHQGSIYFADGTTTNQNYRGTVSYDHSTDSLNFKTAATDRLRIDSTGRLLIGTTTAAGNGVHVLYSTVNSAVEFQNNTTGTGSGQGLYVGNSTSNIGYLWNYANDALVFATNNVERLRIGSSGQIGIAGANYGSSGQVLTSQGSGSAVAWSTITGTTINSNTDNYLITGTGTANTLQGESALTFDGTALLVNKTGGCNIKVNSGGSNVTSMWTTGGTGTQWGSTSNDWAAIMSNNTTRMHVANDGKIGIGTTSPSDLVHLLKSHNSHTRLVVQNNWGSNATAQLKLIAPTDEFQIVKYASGDAYQNLSNSGNIVFQVGGSEKVRMQSAGGISFNGDTAAANALDDYEEGDWTPGFEYLTVDSGASHGKYLKVGNLCWITCFVKADGAGTANDAIRITGLPYNRLSGADIYFSPFTTKVDTDEGGFGPVIHGYSYGSNKIIFERQNPSETGSNAYVKATNCGDDCGFHCTFVYRTT